METMRTINNIYVSTHIHAQLCTIRQMTTMERQTQFEKLYMHEKEYNA